MTDSENSAPQNESDEDIYKDFDEFNFEEELAKITASRESYKKEAVDLSDKVKVLSEENERLTKLNNVLEKNLSTLLKTAQAEVKRKDSVIQELRDQMESFTFRRKSKLTQDKTTNTEDWQSVIGLKNLNEPCSCRMELCNTELPKNLRLSDRVNKLQKNDAKFAKDRSPDCDMKKSSYSRDRATSKSRHSESSFDFPSERNKGSSFSPQRSRSRPSRHSYREDRRVRLKYDTCDTQRFSRRTDKFDYSCRKTNSKSRDIRDESPDRRRKDWKRKQKSPEQKSRSITRTKSFEKHKRSKPSSDNDSKNKHQGEPDTTSKRSCPLKNSKKNEDGRSHEKGKDQNGSDRDSSKNFQKISEKCFKRNDNGTSEQFERKSPLDALYKEMIGNSNRYSKSNLVFNSTPFETENDFIGEEHPEELPVEEKDDWTLSFKNERPIDTKPMTLYSQRMLRKFSTESKAEESKDLTNHVKCQEKNSIEEVEVNTKKSSQDIFSEKEPGELTDDENLIENTEEFQRVAKAAVCESEITEKPVITMKQEAKKLHDDLFKGRLKKDVLNDRRTGSRGSTENFKKPKDLTSSQATSENAPFDKISETSRDFREGIEFSPFKNNYKLIEISPAKFSVQNAYPGKSNRPEAYKKSAKSNSSVQREVESSVFNLLSTLSGVPLDVTGKKTDKKLTNKTDTDGAVEKSETEKKVDSDAAKELSLNSEVKSCDIQRDENQFLEKNKTENAIGEESKSKTQNGNTIKDGDDKERSSIFKNEANENSKSTETQEEDGQYEDGGPGENTQFLDFFLLTTSPSKPILPAEEKAKRCGRGDSSLETSKENLKENTDDNSITTSASEGKESSFGFSLVKKANKTKNGSIMKSNSKSKKLKSPSDKQKQSGSRSENCSSDKRKPKIPKAEEFNSDEHINESGQGKTKRKIVTKKEDKETEEINKKKREGRENDSIEEPAAKKKKLDNSERIKKRGKSQNFSKDEEERNSLPRGKVKEDISFFEFFKPLAKREDSEKMEADDLTDSTDFKMTTTMSVTGVVRLETPNKYVEKLKNLMINEQTIYQVLDPKNNSFSPLIEAKCFEMTPRRMLKNDLMLTDSEDDSALKRHQSSEDLPDCDEISENENSDCESDSGASDFVDLL